MHPLNIDGCISVTLFGIEIDSSFVQPWKDELPISVRLSGSSMDFKETQSQKHLVSINVTEEGILRVVKAEQPLKQSMGSVEMVLGSEMERRLVQ